MMSKIIDVGMSRVAFKAVISPDVMVVEERVNASAVIARAITTQTNKAPVTCLSQNAVIQKKLRLNRFDLRNLLVDLRNFRIAIKLSYREESAPYLD